jgi:hypothetical protein
MTGQNVSSFSWQSRVARWFIFKPKIPNWVNVGGSCHGRFWYILGSFGKFTGHFVYFKAIWNILWPIGILSPFWYIVPRKIWQLCSQGLLEGKPRW